jgi:WD40 repeat protein
MRFSRTTLTIGLLSCLVTAAMADDKPGNAPPTEEIHRLIQQLGDNDLSNRSQARKRLESIGTPVIEFLKKAAEGAADPEIRREARAIVVKIEGSTSGLIRTFRGHGNRVNGVAISADGKSVISASWDGMIRVWNSETGELNHEMRGHTAAIMSVTLSLDGKRALTGSADRSMRLWDLNSGEEIRNFAGHPHTVWDVAFSPDGKKALSGCSDGMSRLWDLESGDVLLTLETLKNGRAWTVAFSPDGNQAVTGGGNSFDKKEATEASLRLWDLATGKEIRQFSGHTKDIRRIAISPNGKQLLSGSFDGTMRLWDLQSGKEIRRFDGQGHFVESVGFTADGQRAICSYGPKVAEAIYEDDPRCSLRPWDLNTGKELQQFKGHTAPVLSLAISADGRLLVSGSADNSVRLWKLPR